MRLLVEEPKNREQLEEMLAMRQDIPRPYSIAVEALIFDSSGKWILMERGPGCRDEIGKLEGVGGGIGDDTDFNTALRREISEEVGDDANIEILKFFEIRRDTVKVPNSLTGEERHWIIVSFICLFRLGELKVCEPTKNSGYFRISIDEADPQKLSSSTASALVSLRKSWKEIAQLLKSAS